MRALFFDNHSCGKIEQISGVVEQDSGTMINHIAAQFRRRGLQ